MADYQIIERVELGRAFAPDGRIATVERVTQDRPHHMTGQASEVVVTVFSNGAWESAAAFPEESDAWTYVGESGDVAHSQPWNGDKIEVRQGLGIPDAFITGRALIVDRQEDPRLAAALDQINQQAQAIAQLKAAQAKSATPASPKKAATK